MKAKTALDGIERLMRAEEWLAARESIHAALAATPNSHRLIASLGLIYYEDRDYSAASICLERARALAPGCPLVLWYSAGTLQMLERHQEAADIYRALIRKGPKRIAPDPCGEGRAWANGLVADSHYRLSGSLAALGSQLEAMAEFENHLDLRGPGCYSIYPLRNLKNPEQEPQIRRPGGKE